MRKKIGILLVIAAILALCIYGYEDIKFEYALNKAEFYSEKGAYDQAIAEYNKLLEVEPGIYELYFNKGVLLAEQGKTDEAYQVFLEAEKINNTDPDLYYNLAHLYQNIDGERYQKYLEQGMTIEFEQGIAED